MAVTSYKFAGTAANVDRDSKTSWSDVNNAKADDNARTSQTVGKGTYSDWLRLTNFGFTTSDIPNISIINGIEVIVDRVTPTDDALNYINDSAIYLRKTSGQVGSNYASATHWPIAEANATYGGGTNLWGATWNSSDILSINFGIDLSAACVNELVGQYAYIDYIKIRIYYTPGWFYNFMGITSANISKINGIDKANIIKINSI